MSNFIEGTITGFLQQQTGTGNNGAWYKQPVVITQPGQYAEQVVVDFWNDKIELLRQFPQGSYVRVSVNTKSRFNTTDPSKYYTELRAWKIENGSATAQPASAAPQFTPAPSPAPAPQPQQYQVGQRVNGHQLQADGRWLPVHAAAPAPAQVPTPAPAPAPTPSAPAAPATNHFAPPSQQQAFQQAQAPAPQAPAPQAPIPGFQ